MAYDNDDPNKGKASWQGFLAAGAMGSIGISVGVYTQNGLYGFAGFLGAGVVLMVGLAFADWRGWI